MNDMRIPRDDLAAFLHPGAMSIPRARSPISYFADGGAVGRIPETGAMQNGGQAVKQQGDTYNITIPVNIDDLIDENFVRRKLISPLNAILRRSPNK